MCMTVHICRTARSDWRRCVLSFFLSCLNDRGLLLTVWIRLLLWPFRWKEHSSRFPYSTPNAIQLRGLEPLASCSQVRSTERCNECGMVRRVWKKRTIHLDAVRPGFTSRRGLVVPSESTAFVNVISVARNRFFCHRESSSRTWSPDMFSRGRSANCWLRVKEGHYMHF